jgi:hypothetical protein
MAGAGYKLFATGDVLTAAQVNTYLNEQTVMVFADSAARTSALSGVLAEGMMSYLQDTNAVEVYNGTAWVGVGNVGDITEVQAGVGISVASGTGPIPVITNSSTDLITTAGDLLYGTAADTVARLGIGTAGQVLKVNSGATAPEWGAGGGKVLQVVFASTSTAVNVASTTPTDSGLTATITPTLATSDILVIYNQVLTAERSAVGVTGSTRLLRGATVIQDLAEAQAITVTGATFVNYKQYSSATYLDAPATTSATTYKTQVNVNTTANGGNVTAQLGSSISSITLLEIGA